MTFQKNETYNEDMVKRVDVINIGGFLDMYDNDLFSYDGVNIDEVEGLSTPMEWASFWLWDTMAKITSQCKESANVKFCDHAKSCLWIVV